MLERPEVAKVYSWPNPFLLAATVQISLSRNIVLNKIFKISEKKVSHLTIIAIFHFSRQISHDEPSNNFIIFKVMEGIQPTLTNISGIGRVLI